MMVSSTPKFSGEPTAKALANGLATLGRYGDNYMVHAAEGETMVPREILEANPGLKADLFQQMTMMGIKDPNRYVVGNSLNSINPITGQPEFFFKKIWKAIKKIGKKVAPIVAPIIGNLILPGIGGILASMAVTKLQGGSWGDVIKSGLMSYGASALGSGIMGGINAPTGGFGSGFAKGLSSGLAAPWEAGANLFTQGPLNPLAQGILGPRGLAVPGVFSSLKTSDFAKAPFGGGAVHGVQDAKSLLGKVLPSYQGAGALQAGGFDPVTGVGGYDPKAFGPITPQTPALRDQVFANEMAAAKAGVPTGTNLVPAPRSYNNPAGTGLIIDPAAPVVVPEVPVDKGYLASILGDKGADLAGQALVASVPAAVVYAMSPDEKTAAELAAQQEQFHPQRVAYEEWSTIQDKESPRAKELYLTWFGTPSYSTAELGSKFGAGTAVQPMGAGEGLMSSVQLGSPGASLTPVSPVAVASGGEVFGPGTGTSDSIPARLSDGEFVMTAEAVRNAGGGDRSRGAARMFDMMNRFEMRGA